MIRRFPGGRSMRIHYVVTSVMAIALAACTGARSPGGPDEGALLRETGLPAGVAARAERPPDPGRSPKDAGPASAAALNSRLMEQAARSSQETDLPVGTGDLLEISVFEVEELSKIRLRVAWTRRHLAPPHRPDSGHRPHHRRAGGRDPRPAAAEVHARSPGIGVPAGAQQPADLRHRGGPEGRRVQSQPAAPPGRRPRPRRGPDRGGRPAGVRDPAATGWGSSFRRASSP